MNTTTAGTATGLQADLDALAQRLSATAPAGVLEVLRTNIEHVAAEIAGQSLKVGDQAPDFTLPGAMGEHVRLSALLQHGPVVLTFYRGEWCPFCNLTLRAYQKALPEFTRLGATLVAISPQTPDNSLTTVEQKALTFPVLSDVGNGVARTYRLVYQLGDDMRAVSKGMGADLTQFNGDEAWELPVPGTFVIGQDGIIRLAFVDANYMKRLEPSAIIAVLEELSHR